MATYQYNILLIPEEEIFHKISFPHEVDFDMWDYNWWKNTVSFKDIEHDLMKSLPEIEWTKKHKNLFGYGKEEMNDVSISLDDKNYIETIHVRIDLRNIDHGFIKYILKLAIKNNCGFIDRQGNLFNPTLEQLKSSIEKSNAFKFVKDPNKFLSGINSDELNLE